MTLRFDGKVAVVTGAGSGLGKAYALELARRGASVVINDLGCSFHGEGKEAFVADVVVKEIIAAGGKAVANYDSVENGDNIINTAISTFGRVDIVINNAGILRDKSFTKMSEEEWDAIFKVHNKGAFKVTKAAWPHMRRQKYGRIIMATSSSGLYGNFGQANYSSAKLSLVGLANTLALEGHKSNIFVNCIAPIAETRMTVDLMGDSGMMSVAHIVPFVMYLCHESCGENGSIIETGGGFASKVRLEKTPGVQLRSSVSDNLTLEKVAERWSDFTQFSTPPTAGTNAGTTAKIMETIQTLPEKTTSEKFVDDMVNHQTPAISLSYTEDDLIKYALSVGAKLPSDMQYLYEGAGNFYPIPSYLATIAVEHMGALYSGAPGMDQIDLSRVLHGEQYVEVLKPLPTNATFTMSPRFVDALDKGRFCSLISEADILDENGTKMATTQSVVICMGSGGIGRKGKSDKQILTVAIPNRAPDEVVEEETTLNQAALFRLNGDKNLLHIDPSISSLMGFENPILHGLCSYGFALRHVIKTYANNDMRLLKAIKAQFSKPVVPGNTLVTEMWRDGTRIMFQTKVKETGNISLKGGFIDLIEVHEPRAFTSRL